MGSKYYVLIRDVIVFVHVQLFLLPQKQDSEMQLNQALTGCINNVYKQGFSSLLSKFKKEVHFTAFKITT